MDTVRGFTNGCFDLLHNGHRHFLQQCRHLCGYLTVAVNSDQSIRRLKGPGRPVQSISDRVAALQGLRWADEVLVFDEDTPYRLIDRLGPDLIFKGGDYRPEDVVGADIARVVIIPRLPGYSTTQEIQCLRNS
jgi:D-beta-D-heptose 7-phosphate kinase/D-beta-D-heptose 1-phosphate adenosyltransferase